MVKRLKMYNDAYRNGTPLIIMDLSSSKEIKPIKNKGYEMKPGKLLPAIIFAILGFLDFPIFVVLVLLVPILSIPILVVTVFLVLIWHIPILLALILLVSTIAMIVLWAIK